MGAFASLFRTSPAAPAAVDTSAPPPQQPPVTTPEFAPLHEASGDFHQMLINKISRLFEWLREVEAALDHLRDLPAPACRHHLAVSLVAAKEVGSLKAIITNGLQAEMTEIKKAQLTEDERAGIKEIIGWVRDVKKFGRYLKRIGGLGGAAAIVYAVLKYLAGVL